MAQSDLSVIAFLSLHGARTCFVMNCYKHNEQSISIYVPTDPGRAFCWCSPVRIPEGHPNAVRAYVFRLRCYSERPPAGKGGSLDHSPDEGIAVSRYKLAVPHQTYRRGLLRGGGLSPTGVGWAAIMRHGLLQVFDVATSPINGHT
ncbi:hypothetical protein GGS23DRAFT_549516 [Durotheca rogersii]|uniref:uncharacterized protein n=1 Tax=Durotheca rogersii TaxID=419775 RepID=UPI00221FEE90|nr:uncharacterized protein GGS23DRAFT_549516 [Durotheca rogersii]KAI5867696.1 hypothetical protein GGS23DRAFT_549516 [Durotheca rogersii]